MSNLKITHKGQLIADVNSPRFLVNNFTQSGTETGWSFGTHTFAGGTIILTGVNPSFSCVSFTVGANDIICVEFNFALPTPSSMSGGGKGVYIGTRSGQSVYVHSFNMTTKSWGQASSTTTNPYFLNAYNLVPTISMKNYILGTGVSLSDVPWGDTSNTSYLPKAIQLTGSDTTTYLRSGYNQNSEMVIHFSNPCVYNINQSGYYEANAVTRAKFGNNWVNSFEFMEY